MPKRRGHPNRVIANKELAHRPLTKEKIGGEPFCIVPIAPISVD
jgi:hypothetical protein